MERFTERDEYGNADITGVSSLDLQYNLALREFNKVTDALNRLADYEDLEEQGKLLELPCAVGDTVYRVNIGAKEPIIHMEVCEVGIISLKEKGYVIQIMCRDEVGNGETYYLGTDFGKAVFFTEPEAEQALEEIRE